MFLFLWIDCFNYFHFPFNILWLCFTIRFVLASAHGFKIKGLKWKKKQDECPKYSGSTKFVCPAIYCLKQNTVSTFTFNIHLFNFALSTCCGHIMPIVIFFIIFLNCWTWLYKYLSVIWTFFSLISPSDIVIFNELTRKLKIIGLCDLKHIKTSPIKTNEGLDIHYH